MTTALVFFFGIGLLVFTLTGIGVYVFSLVGGLSSDGVPWGRLALLTALLGVFALPYLALQGIYRGLQAQPVLNLVMSIGRIVSVSSAIVAAWNGASVEQVFLLFNADKMFVVAVMVRFLYRQRPGIQLGLTHYSLARLRSLFNFGRWIMLARLATFLEYQIDNLLVMIIGGPVAVAAYTVITTPFRMIQQVSGLASQAIVPVVSGNASTGDSKIVTLVKTTGVRWHNALLAITWTLCLINADYLLNLWLQGRFSEHYWLIKVLIAFQALWQSNAFLGMVATGLGHVRPIGILAIWTAIANFVLSVTLINFFGFYGVIYGTLLAGVCTAPIASIILTQVMGMRLFSYLSTCLRGQLPSVAMAALVSIAPWTILSGLPLLFISTILIFAVNGLLMLHEREAIKRPSRFKSNI